MSSHLTIVDRDIELAAQLLRDGKLVAFATETVYGLGADALPRYRHCSVCWVL